MTRRFRRGCGTMGNSPPTGSVQDCLRHDWQFATDSLPKVETPYRSHYDPPKPAWKPGMRTPPDTTRKEEPVGSRLLAYKSLSCASSERCERCT
jgi:hypothetical protein